MPLCLKREQIGSRELVSGRPVTPPRERGDPAGGRPGMPRGLPQHRAPGAGRGRRLAVVSRSASNRQRPWLRPAAAGDLRAWAASRLLTAESRDGSPSARGRGAALEAARRPVSERGRSCHRRKSSGLRVTGGGCGRRDAAVASAASVQGHRSPPIPHPGAELAPCALTPSSDSPPLIAPARRARRLHVHPRSAVATALPRRGPVGFCFLTESLARPASQSGALEDRLWEVIISFILSRTPAAPRVGSLTGDAVSGWPRRPYIFV